MTQNNKPITLQVWRNRRDAQLDLFRQYMQTFGGAQKLSHAQWEQAYAIFAKGFNKLESEAGNE